MTTMPPPTTTGPMTEPPSAEALASAVDRAREQLAPLDEDIRKKADSLLDAHKAFTAAGVREIVRRLKADDRARQVLFELVDDPLVYAVLLDLRIVKPDVVTRVARAMERIKPYVAGHGGLIELVKVEAGVVFVRMHGSCAGCSMSAATLRDGVEEVIRAEVPEITEVREVKGPPVAGVVPLTIGASNDHGWVRGPLADEVAEGACVRVTGEGCDAIVVRRDGRLFAYRNSCPHQGLSLHDGECEGDTLTCPWHGLAFDVTSGECLNEPQVQLEPYPLRVEDGVVCVRPNGGTP